MSNSQIKQHPTCRFEGKNIVYAIIDDENIRVEQEKHQVFSFREKIEAVMSELRFQISSVIIEKCMDIACNNESSLVIGADTIVVLDDMILGKPKDKDEAYCMLKKLSNKVHQVITGISLINLEGNKKIIDYVVSNVKFKDLSEEDIKDYIQTDESLDKAGAYGIQGYGALLVEEIKGDYFNIVGLPISRISDLLKQHFSINLFYGG